MRKVLVDRETNIVENVIEYDEREGEDPTQFAPPEDKLMLDDENNIAQIGSVWDGTVFIRQPIEIVRVRTRGTLLQEAKDALTVATTVADIKNVMDKLISIIENGR